MSLNNKTCVICGEKYHKCRSCGVKIEDWEYDTSKYCSSNCAEKEQVIKSTASDLAKQDRYIESVRESLKITVNKKPFMY